MNTANYKVLQEILDELCQEEALLENEIKKNLLKIEESDIYIKSFTDKEDDNFKIFSPRDIESAYKNEIVKSQDEKEILLSFNVELEKKKDSLNLKKERIKNILKEENELAHNYEVLQIQEEDRRRIARDLHDISLQSLAHVIHEIELSNLYIDKDPVRAKLELSLVNKNLKNVIDEIRSIIFDLRPMTFDDLGLHAALERLLTTISEKNAFKLDFDIDDVVCDNDLVLLTIYRVVQEAFYNIIKHASADKIFFRCKQINDICRVEIIDNGSGFEQTEVDKKSNNHFGLSVMRERVNLLGGKFKIFSEPGKGTNIEIEVPLN